MYALTPLWVLHIIWRRITGVRILQIPHHNKPSEFPNKTSSAMQSTSSMERRFNRYHHYANQNNNILPVILYLTLPTVNLQQKTRNDNSNNVKSQKQKQRDFWRMKQFNEQKTVCSAFPFYSLENDEIKNMVTSDKCSQTTSKADQTKIFNLHEENVQLRTEILELKCQIRTVNEKLACMDSELKSKLNEKQTEIQTLKSESSNLNSKLHNEQCSREEIETKYLAFRRHTEIAVRQQEQHNDNINKHNLREISNLKSTIQQLNMELSAYKSQTTTSTHIQGGTKNPSNKQTSAHQERSNNMQTTSQKINQRKSTTASGCRKCGSATYHQPRQCPAKNFVCIRCSKKGHHTINCILICTACSGIKGISCKSPEDCVAKDMNCAYCNVQGHLDCVCLKRRMDELGY